MQLIKKVADIITKRRRIIVPFSFRFVCVILASFSFIVCVVTTVAISNRETVTEIRQLREKIIIDGNPENIDTALEDANSLVTLLRKTYEEDANTSVNATVIKEETFAYWIGNIENYISYLKLVKEHPNQNYKFWTVTFPEAVKLASTSTENYALYPYAGIILKALFESILALGISFWLFEARRFYANKWLND